MTMTKHVCPTCERPMIDPLKWCDSLILEENESLRTELAEAKVSVWNEAIEIVGERAGLWEQRWKSVRPECKEEGQHRLQATSALKEDAIAALTAARDREG